MVIGLLTSEEPPQEKTDGDGGGGNKVRYEVTLCGVSFLPSDSPFS